MSKKSKNINVVIEFDNEEYSEEETTFLYQRFINILAEAKRDERCTTISWKSSCQGYFRGIQTT